MDADPIGSNGLLIRSPARSGPNSSPFHREFTLTSCVGAKLNHDPHESRKGRHGLVGSRVAEGEACVAWPECTDGNGYCRLDDAGGGKGRGHHRDCRPCLGDHRGLRPGRRRGGVSTETRAAAALGPGWGHAPAPDAGGARGGARRFSGGSLCELTSGAYPSPP